MGIDYAAHARHRRETGLEMVRYPIRDFYPGEMREHCRAPCGFSPSASIIVFCWQNICEGSSSSRKALPPSTPKSRPPWPPKSSSDSCRCAFDLAGIVQPVEGEPKKAEGAHRESPLLNVVRGFWRLRAYKNRNQMRVNCGPSVRRTRLWRHRA